MLENTVRVGIAGLGFGSNFVEIFRTHPRSEIRAVCDTDQQLLGKIQKKYHVPSAYNRFSDLVADQQIDAVLIMSPVTKHYEMVKASLSAGKHTACAVPMAETKEECLDLVNQRRNSQKVYMMFETAVYTRTCLHVKNLRDTGQLGKIQFLRGSHQQNMSMPGWPSYWYGYPPMLYATHALSPLLALSRKPVAEVVCYGSGTIREEYAKIYGSPFAIESALMKLDESDVACEVTRSLFDTIRQYRESIDVYADKLSFEWEQVAGEGPVLFSGLEEASRIEIPDYAHLLPEEIRMFTGGQVNDESHASSVQGGGHGGSYPHMVHEFISAIVEERPSEIDADVAANWTMAGICAHDSALQGGVTVELPKTRL